MIHLVWSAGSFQSNPQRSRFFFAPDCFHMWQRLRFFSVALPNTILMRVDRMFVQDRRRQSSVPVSQPCTRSSRVQLSDDFEAPWLIEPRGTEASLARLFLGQVVFISYFVHVLGKAHRTSAQALSRTQRSRGRGAGTPIGRCVPPSGHGLTGHTREATASA